jgi:hypothetical protein
MLRSRLAKPGRVLRSEALKGPKRAEKRSPKRASVLTRRLAEPGAVLTSRPQGGVLTSGGRRPERAEKRSPKGVAC